jgi:hypothetical protein
MKITNLEFLNAKRLRNLIFFIRRHDLDIFDRSIYLDSSEIKNLGESHPENYNLKDGHIIIQEGLVIAKYQDELIILPQKYYLDSDYKAVYPDLVSITIEQVLVKLSDRLGIDWIINKITDLLIQKYEISYGQGKAILRKVLQLRLSSTERSHLNELKNKIKKYKTKVLKFQEVIMHFEDYIRSPKDEIYDEGFFEREEDRILPINSYIFQELGTIIDDEFKKELKEKARQLSNISNKDDVRKKTMDRYNKNRKIAEIFRNLTPFEIKAKPSESTIAYFHCKICEFSYLIPSEELEVNGYFSMPKHCNQFMRIRLEKSE